MRSYPSAEIWAPHPHPCWGSREPGQGDRQSASPALTAHVRRCPWLSTEPNALVCRGPRGAASKRPNGRGTSNSTFFTSATTLRWSTQGKEDPAPHKWGTWSPNELLGSSKSTRLSSGALLDGGAQPAPLTDPARPGSAQLGPRRVSACTAAPRSLSPHSERGDCPDTISRPA